MNDYLTEADSRRFAILDSAGHAVIGTDISGSIAHWNSAAERLYGWRREEVLGRNIVDVTPTEQSREQSLAIMSMLAAGELWSGVFRVRDRSGRLFEAAVTDIPLRRSGVTTGIVGVSAENTAAADVGQTLRRFADRQLGHERISIGDDLSGMKALVSEPHLIQLFTILLLKLHDLAADPTPVCVEARRSPSRLKLDFGLESAREWLYMSFSLDMRDGRPDVRDALRSRSTSRYAASLVDLAGGKLFARSLPRSGAAFHLFLPVR